MLFDPEDPAPRAERGELVTCPGCEHQLGTRERDGSVRSSVRTKHFGSRTTWNPERIQCEVCGAIWRARATEAAA